MYDLILVDADNTLFDYDKSERVSLVSTFRGFELNIDDSIIERFRQLNASLWKDMENGLLSKEQFRVTRFQKLFDEFDIDIEAGAFNEKYLKVLAIDDSLVCGAEELCSYMSRKYKICIVTNGISEIQHSRLDKSKIAKYIDSMIVSEDVGVKKPHSSIFKYALEVASHKEKSSVLMIGDSLKSDIEGGNNYGIDTCWVNTKGVSNYSTIKPTYEVKCLKDIFRIC